MMLMRVAGRSCGNGSVRSPKAVYVPAVVQCALNNDAGENVPRLSCKGDLIPSEKLLAPWNEISNEATRAGEASLGNMTGSVERVHIRSRKQAANNGRASAYSRVVR
jgi:hypothetical protein